MKARDYKKALLAHFDVRSTKELRANEQWQAIVEQHALLPPRNLKSWKASYEAVFGVDKTEPEQTNTKIEQASEDKATIQRNEESFFKDLEASWKARYEAIFGPEETKSESKEKEAGSNIVTVLSAELVMPQQSQPSEAENLSEETIACIELQNHEGQLVGALLEYSPKQSQALIEHFQSLALHSPEAWHTGKLNPAVVDQLGSSSALLASGLQAGQLFRVVGPPGLIQGINRGAYQMIQSGQGSLGAVRNLSTGKIAGNLRFAQASALPILAPVMAYQVLHAIVGTQQLNQINQRLTAIELCLADLHVRQEAAILGEIHYAINVLDDILHEQMNTGVFTSDASNRLALVEKSILSLLERNRLLVERFRDKAEAVKKRRRKQGARSAASLLKSDGPQAIHDMQCLVGLIAADFRLEQALLLLAMQNNPTDVGRRQQRLQKKMESHRQLVENLPSLEEIEHHAKACVKAMKWWERLFDFGQTQGEVQQMQNLMLQDICPDFAALQPSLGGYVFWQDADGTHAFSMSGDDLMLQPTADSDKVLLKITITENITIDSPYQFALPESGELVEVDITEELETGLWWGSRKDCDKQVMICHQDYGRQDLMQEARG